MTEINRAQNRWWEEESNGQKWDNLCSSRLIKHLLRSSERSFQHVVQQQNNRTMKWNSKMIPKGKLEQDMKANDMKNFDHTSDTTEAGWPKWTCTIVWLPRTKTEQIGRCTLRCPWAKTFLMDWGSCGFVVDYKHLALVFLQFSHKHKRTPLSNGCLTIFRCKSESPCLPPSIIFHILVLSSWL